MSADALVLLRASSGPRVGLGHVMRTRAVAEAVLELGGRARLVVDDELNARALREHGLEAACVTDDPHWTSAPARGAWLDGFVDWSAELRALARGGTPGWLVENRTVARERCARLVHPALHHEADAWERVHPDRVLSGAGWIPLARQVRETRPSRERDVELLVTFGGSDPLRSTERVLAALPEGLAIAVSVGPHMAGRRRAIEELAARRRVRVLDTGEPLAPWMARARVAVTALGTTLYELAYLCTPALILANYESDRAALEHYRVHGPHRPVGIAGEIGERELATAIARGLAEARSPSAPVAELGEGALRIARGLLGLETAARTA